MIIFRTALVVGAVAAAIYIYRQMGLVGPFSWSSIPRWMIGVAVLVALLAIFAWSYP